jgi:hypothetical protein
LATGSRGEVIRDRFCGQGAVTGIPQMPEAIVSGISDVNPAPFCSYRGRSVECDQPLWLTMVVSTYYGYNVSQIGSWRPHNYRNVEEQEGSPALAVAN